MVHNSSSPTISDIQCPQDVPQVFLAPMKGTSLINVTALNANTNSSSNQPSSQQLPGQRSLTHHRVHLLPPTSFELQMCTPDGLCRLAILGFLLSHSCASTNPSSDHTLPSPGWLSQCSGRFSICLMFGTGQSTTTYLAYSQSSKIHLSFGPTRPTPHSFLCLHHFHF